MAHDRSPTEEDGATIDAPADTADIEPLLLDGDVHERIAALVGIDRGEAGRAADRPPSPIAPSRAIVELAPGLGNLTIHLVRRAPKLVAIEPDRAMLPKLNELFFAPTDPLLHNVTFVEGDPLAFDFSSLPSGNWTAVSVLSPRKTGPTLLHFNQLPARIVEGVFVVQFDVARRLIAPPGTSEYGALTVLVGASARAELCFLISRSAFAPEPPVERAAVRLKRRKTPALDRRAYPLFERVVRAGFAKRRKDLWTSLRGAINKTPHGAPPRQPIGDDMLKHALSIAAIDPSQHGESVRPEEFALLARALGDLLEEHPG